MKTRVEIKVGILAQLSQCVRGLTALNPIDTRHGSSEDLLVANPNHKDQYEEEEIESDREAQATGSDNIINETS
jgi:hypothetical protein